MKYLGSRANRVIAYGVASVSGTVLSVLFSVAIGLLMHLVFRREETERANAQAVMPEADVPRPLWQTAAYFAAMVGILVFANWGPADGVGTVVYRHKWHIASACGLGLGSALVLWFGGAVVEDHGCRRRHDCSRRDCAW